MCRSYGFSVQNSLNKGPFSADFPQAWVDLPEIGKKLSKMGSFSQKFIIKVGMTATVGN